MPSKPNLGTLVLLLLCLQPSTNWSAAAQMSAPPAAGQAPPGPLAALGPGDSVTLHVFGQPDMDGQLGVSEDGTINVPLAGPVQVGGLSPDDAARKIERALKDGGYFVGPHVTLTVMQSLSQRVSVLGEVRTPGRYPVDSKTTIVDLLAQAGGETEFGSDTVYVLRIEDSGTVQRYPVDLKGLAHPGTSTPTQLLRAGDSVFVPKAEQFFILGEVQKPSMYKLEANLTVIQAIALAGGVTPKGSVRRVEIKRVGKNNEQLIIKPKSDDPVLPGDVIRVKESIF